MVTSVPPARTKTRGPLPDVAADDVEDQIDSADVLQGVVIEVDELLRAEVERGLPVGSSSGADDMGASYRVLLSSGSSAIRLVPTP
jgi:hypothetical protein